MAVNLFGGFATDMTQNAQTVREFNPFSSEYGDKQERERQSALLIQALELQEILETLPFDPLQLYCVKTGQPRAKRTYAQLYSLAALHSKDQSKLLLTLLKEDGCAVHWAQTDGATLDRLRTIDPVGYFIYAAERLVRHHYRPNKHLGESEWLARAPLFQQKIINYKSLADKFGIGASGASKATANSQAPNLVEIAPIEFVQPRLALALEDDDSANDDNSETGIELSAANISALHVANAHLAKFLGYDITLLALPWKSIDDVVHSLARGNLYHTLAHCFRRWITRESEFFNAGKLNDLLSNKKGASNFRTKRETNQEKRLADLLAELEEMGVNVHQFREPVMAKSAYNPKSRTETLYIDMAKFGLGPKAPRVTQSEQPAPKSFLGLFGTPKKED